MFEPRKAVYTPAQSATVAIDVARDIQSKKHRGFPLPLFRDYFDDLLPGELCILQAQTSNGKSFFAHFWEREAAYALQEMGREDEVIVHVSLEELIENQVYVHMGRETGDRPGEIANGNVQNWDNLYIAAEKIGTMPVYRIGASLAHPEDMPELYLSNIQKCIDAIKAGQITDRREKIAAVFVDYLQVLPIDPEVKRAGFEQARRLQVREDINRAFQMAANYQAPIIMLAQSKQTLGESAGPLKIPRVYDIEETSAGAQRADRVISLAMPKQSFPPGKLIDPGDGRLITVKENQMFVHFAKQRGGRPAGASFECEIDFNGNSLRRVK